jgi:putative tryptophan/tyrosine transport system substrate-binding protein
MKRRAILAGLGGTFAWPLAVRAQPAGKVFKVGLVFTTSPVSEMIGPDPIHPHVRVFIQALRDLGYVEGQNLVLECRSAEGRFERFGEIVAELVARKVDVIVRRRPQHSKPQEEVPMEEVDLPRALPCRALLQQTEAVRAHRHPLR